MTPIVEKMVFTAEQAAKKVFVPGDNVDIAFTAEQAAQKYTAFSNG